MAYYIRVLSPNSARVPLSVLRKSLADARLQAVISADSEEAAWEELVVSYPDGGEICVIERNEVAATGLGREEIDEFLEEIADCQPPSAAAWLATYLLSVHEIYALQILHGTYKNNGWEIVGLLKSTIMGTAGGIIQADNEGFTNEDGYHVLWQFAEDAADAWWMAVLDKGRWRRFQMDLGNRDHRAAFFRGEAPAGVETRD